MRETTFATYAVQKRRASGHAVTADGPVPVEPLVARAYGPAGTSVLSTATDLLRFAALAFASTSVPTPHARHRGMSITENPARKPKCDVPAPVRNPVI